MKTKWMRGVVFFLAAAIVLLPSTAEAQESSRVPITITPVAATIAAPGDGGQAPTFVVETKPNQDVALVFATSLKSFYGSDSFSIKKHYSTYNGNNEAGIDPIALKANESGQLVFTLLDEVFEAMAEEGGKIYYVAEAIRPLGALQYDLLGESFSPIHGDPEEAPYVTIEESSTLRQAKEHFRAGQDLYKNGDYLEAVQEFEAAHELKPYAAFRYNIGVCYLRLASTFLGDYLNSGEALKKEEGELRDFLNRVQTFIKAIAAYNRRP